MLEHLDHFDPFAGGRQPDPRDGRRVTGLATMALTYAERHPEPSGAAIDAIVARLMHIRSGPRLAHRVPRDPAEFGLVCGTYGALRRLGHEDPSMRELLQRAVDAGILDEVGRLPRLRMDLRLSLEHAGIRHRWPSFGAMAAESILASPLAVPLMDDASAHALTHAVMTATAFGLVDEPGLRTVPGLGETIDGLVAASARAHRWDLLAELLMCVDCAGLPRTPVTERGWACLLWRRRRPDGAVPGPLTAMGPHRDIDARDRSEWDVARHCRTTLTAIMAGTLRLAGAASRPAAAGGWTGVRRTSPEAVVAEPAVRGALAHAAGWLCDDPVPVATASRGPLPSGDALAALDLADAECLPLLADAVQQGRIPSAERDDARRLAAALGAAAARRHDLCEVALMAESLRLLGAPARAQDRLIGFLLAQQAADGSFGSFGPEIPAMRELLGPAFDPETDLIVPVTLACVGALSGRLDRGW
jgi:hypothetical protein